MSVDGSAWSLPPSALPGISPSRGEIDKRLGFAHHDSCEWSNGRASCRSSPLRGRCPAGQRGVSPTRHHQRTTSRKPAPAAQEASGSPCTFPCALAMRRSCSISHFFRHRPPP
ncbi:hypothetical protein B0909_08945 [Rhizobium rhizogenes]|nr:hypothetical protein B0909_08945 [Rhizobium rhizogenes]